jgi:hypothetical protein
MIRIISYGWPLVLLILMLASVPTLDHFINSPDMGYQLSLGRLMLLGKFPFVDMFQHYGPLVVFTSAAGQWIHHSTLPETIICAMGYCLAMVCIFRVVQRGAARPGLAMIVGIVASFSAWCILSRFYKWYYWVFPMLLLLALARSRGESKTRFWCFATGMIAGIAFLYRHDMGMACIGSVMATLLLQAYSGGITRKFLVEMAWVLGGFVLPLACWFLTLTIVGGPISCRWYISAILSGTAGVTQHWRTPLPLWDWQAPLSEESCRFMVLAMMGLSFGVAIFLGAKDLLRQKCSADAVPLFAAGLLGVALSPQALYRPDLQHILQSISPLFVVASFIILRLVGRHDSQPPAAWKYATKVATALVYVTLLALPLGRLHAWLRVDLASLGTDLPGRYRSLAVGLDAADPNNAVVQVARAVQQHATPKQRILVVPLMPQIYYWVNRPMSGLLNGYAGIFAGDTWRKRNLEAVQREPPSLIIVDRDFLNGKPDALFRKHNPELYDWLKKHYSHVVAECGTLVVCDGPSGLNSQSGEKE